MLKLYKVETKQTEVSEREVKVSQDPTAEGFISGLSEFRSEYNRSLALFSRNHKIIYDLVKDIARKEDYILLCLEDRWGLSPPNTNFGLASLESTLGEVFWRSWTTIDMQRSRYPSYTDEEIFENAFNKFIKEYFDQSLSSVPILVSDQHNFQRCLDVLDGMGLEYEVMS